MANRNTFLINPQGNIAKVWVKVNPADGRVGCAGGDSVGFRSPDFRMFRLVLARVPKRGTWGTGLCMFCAGRPRGFCLL